MAVDTRNRRFAMIGLGVPWTPRPMPNPDNSFNVEADRIHLLYLYRGIVPSSLGGDVSTRMPLTGVEG